jgi:hypothetical protein
MTRSARPRRRTSAQPSRRMITEGGYILDNFPQPDSLPVFCGDAFLALDTSLYTVEEAQEWEMAIAAAQALRANTPPAPRLVGIEPNPGPKAGPLASAVRGARGVAKLAAAIGRMATQPKPLAPMKKKKKGHRQPRAPRASSSTVSSTSNQLSRAAPVNLGTINRNKFRSARQAINFTVASMTIRTDSLSIPYIVAPTSAPGTLSDRSFELNPITTGSANQSFPFGPQIAQIAPAYDRFRFTKLSLQFETVTPTNIPGNLAFAYVQDPVEVSTAGMTEFLTYPNVASCDGAVSGPVWSVWGTDFTPYLTKDMSYFVNLPPTPTSGDNHFSEQGQIIVSGLNLPASSILGVMRLTGTIVLEDVALVVYRTTELSELGQPPVGSVWTSSGTGFGSTEAAPLADVGPIVGPASPPWQIVNNSNILFGNLGAVDSRRANGTYKVEVEWSQAVGGTGAASMLEELTGDAEGAVFAESYAGTPPYASTYSLTLYIPPDPADNSHLSTVITGPADMTSGQYHLTVTRIA